MFRDPCDYIEPVVMDGGQLEPPPPAPTPTPTPSPTPPPPPAPGTDI